ncbi:MAG: glycosyl hydrolase 115 family protein [Clostridia bacterium]|nr:glycosyl hydrolase 115 family protein [Clostridia bacterium]
MDLILTADGALGVYLAKGEKSWVSLAADDLIKDICRVCGGAKRVETAEQADIVLCSAESEEFSALFKEVAPFSCAEEFFYQVKDGKAYIFGADDLGLIWGIYTFSERELHIPPDYLFDGVEFIQKQEWRVAEKQVRERPYTRFRGWFINDEDLLSGYQSQGEREIDYFFYKKVIHPDLMDKIVETALRMKINLIIPSTLVDICNPAEEALVERVARRGLYVSQHHIEPLGVSHYGMRRFLREHGYDENNISFITNREGMIAGWKHYAQKWSKYPRVFWQLGLRGNSDIPVWVSDKSVGNTDEARGALISDAIFTQYAIVKEYAKGEIFTSMTVWMESAHLLETGNLRLPQDTVTVFADIGASQLFADDFFKVPREENRDYGVYYHAGYWNVGPHLAEGVIPQKMDYCYRLARQTQAGAYSVLNVANLKEFTFSARLNANLVWQGENADLKALITEYCEGYAGENAAALVSAIQRYYSAFGDVGEEVYKDFCDRNNFNYHAYTGLPFASYALNDGFVCWFLRRPFEDKVKYFDAFLGQTLRAASQAMKQARKELQEIPINRGKERAFACRWLYQAYYWEKLIAAALEVFYAVEKAYRGEGGLAEHYARAASRIQELLRRRGEMFVGEWENWFAFDTKLNIPALLEFLKQQEEHFKE